MNDVQHSHDHSTGGMGFLLGIILLVLFLYLLFVYGLPALRGGGGGGTNITVPEQVDLNVNQGGGQ